MSKATSRTSTASSASPASASTITSRSQRAPGTGRSVRWPLTKPSALLRSACKARSPSGSAPTLRRSERRGGSTQPAGRRIRSRSRRWPRSEANCVFSRTRAVPRIRWFRSRPLGGAGVQADPQAGLCDPAPPAHARLPRSPAASALGTSSWSDALSAPCRCPYAGFAPPALPLRGAARCNPRCRPIGAGRRYSRSRSPGSSCPPRRNAARRIPGGPSSA